MALKQLVGPTVEPVSLAEARQFLRIDDDFTDDDALVLMLIASARRSAEQLCRRVLISQQWRLVFDRFPSPMSGRLTEYWMGQQWALGGMGGAVEYAPTGKSQYEIILPVSPLISVDQIVYIDQGGTTQTLSAANYKSDVYAEPPRILPAYGKAWPGTRSEINAVQIDFTAGYGASASAVPEPIRQWILMMVSSAYENREPLVPDKVAAQPRRFLDGLLDPYRVLEFV